MACRSAGLLQHVQSVLATQATSPSSFKAFLRGYTSTQDDAVRVDLLKVEFDLHKYDLPELQPVSDEYCSTALLVDLFQKSLMFAVNEGFSCSEVNQFLCLYLHTLTLVASTHRDQQSGPVVNVTLPEVLKEFRSAVLDYSQKLTHTHFLASVAYITDTVFKHFRLYQYLLTQEQPVDLTTVELDLPHPQLPPPLTEAKQEQEWVRSEQTALLAARQEKKRKEFVETSKSVMKEEEDRLRGAYQSELAKVAARSELEEEEVRKLVESLTDAHLQSTKVAISQIVQRHSLELGMKTEKLEMLSPNHKLKQQEE